MSTGIFLLLLAFSMLSILIVSCSYESKLKDMEKEHRAEMSKLRQEYYNLITEKEESV